MGSGGSTELAEVLPGRKSFAASPDPAWAGSAFTATDVGAVGAFFMGYEKSGLVSCPRNKKGSRFKVRDSRFHGRSKAFFPR
jgi:hypothetical protein